MPSSARAAGRRGRAGERGRTVGTAARIRAAFEAANPALYGDPRTLNLASLYSSRCFAAVNCTFERRFTDPGNSTVTWDITFLPPAGVAMSASPSSFTVAPGETADVTFVTAVVTLPPGVAYAGWAGTDWTCTETPAVECTRTGVLAAAAETTLRMSTLVAASTDGDVSATVTVASASGDADTADNTATAVTTVSAPPDLFADGFEG